MSDSKVKFGGFYCSNDSLNFTLEIVKEIYGISEHILNKVTPSMPSEQDRLVVELFIRRFLHTMLKDFDSLLIWMGSMDDECDENRLRVQKELRIFGEEKLTISKNIQEQIENVETDDT